jgi:hypothetical protein
LPLRRLHDSAVKNLTPEQLTIARFWANLSGPGHSLAIASQIPVQESANLETAAETYARVGIAVADAVTAVWHAKYTDNLLRSVTYIRKAIDPVWTSAIPTSVRCCSNNAGVPFRSERRIRLWPGDADGFSRIYAESIFSTATLTARRRALRCGRSSTHSIGAGKSRG